MEESKKKVYLETSFVSYLTGRATTREPIASWQAERFATLAAKAGSRAPRVPPPEAE